MATKPTCAAHSTRTPNRGSEVNLDWTFWEWGKKGNVVGEQKVKLLRSAGSKKGGGRCVMLQVKAAWLACQETMEEYRRSRTAIARAEENFRIYQDRFNQQMSTTTDVLDAQTLLSQARIITTIASAIIILHGPSLKKPLLKELK